MGDTTAAGTRCPRCSAAVRPGAPWCTQCYAPAGAPAGAPADGPAPSAPLPRTSAGIWPCSACDAANDLELAACQACGTAFLAAVREDRPTVVLPVVGDVLALTPVRRVGLAVGVVLAFLLTTSLLALLLA